MDNYWDTNFKADLGGFYEFAYDIYVDHGHVDANTAIDRCCTLNEGLIGFPI